MSEGVQASIHGFYAALISGDVNRILSFCTENATLNWGPFTFKGKQEIKRWATGLIESFPMLKIREFRENRPIEHEKKVVNRFSLEVATPNGQRGLISGEGAYEFKNSKIHRIWINLSHGCVLIDRKEFKNYL